MDWINRTTVIEAKVLLRNTEMLIYEISDKLNIPEPTAFNRYLKKHTGETPASYRKAGAEIEFKILPGLNHIQACNQAYTAESIEFLLKH